MRMHVAINVKNLEQSLRFYKILFQAEPTKVKDNYAKFELDNPALHFSLNVRAYENKGVLNHFGFQVKNTEEVEAAKDRLQAAGLVPLDEMNTTCCYAVQDKVWVTDPEGNPWEVFYTKKDSEFEAAEDRVMPSACCATPSKPTTTVPVSELRGKSECC
ncbi:hypothetical protein SD70_30990 [Gordoniibacillus kamchatkensis]|uniref:VOC domain-containing protein n=1 Tax=Gordoniibacillus kamchatkensis TaxID=1590651 RepID=A0ABR5A812_9BACL|nr:ArsI/CadI family heavy metal resistance metalloenzyme [Paenibacillus sp. VKM B-2647]KIL37153.1 hypothetical protein SD70_30990 [Paenibacillus sp. VKM B-2647]